MKNKILFLITFCISTQLIFSQIQTNSGSPLPFQRGNNVAKKSLLEKNTSADFFQKIPFDSISQTNSEKNGKFIVGKNFSVDYTPENSGTTFITDEGQFVWRLGIYSPDAAAIGFVFSEFEIPEEGKLFIYNPNQTNILGAFTSINNNSNKILPISPLSGDSIIIEYQEPWKSKLQARLKIGKVSHNTLDIAAKNVLGTGTFGASEACSTHAAFVEKAKDIRRAACLLYVTGNTYTWLGSGTLINNSEGKPYLLTAAHNVDETDCEKTIISYFNYEVPAIDSLIRGSQEFTLGGATLIARAFNIDFALLELTQMPPVDYRPYLAGWNRETTVPAPLMGVQHPEGDIKRVSFENDVPVSTTYPYEDLKETVLTDSHWKINKWNKGTTEPGSSGSALFDNDNLIVGGLTGGESECSNPILDYYFRLNKAWDYYTLSTKQLKCWLDSENSDVTKMEGKDPYESNPCVRINNINTSEKLGKEYIGNGKTGLLSGHNELLHTEFAEKFVRDTNSYLYGVYIVPAIGKRDVNSKVYVKVYNGTDAPANLLTSVEFNPKEMKYRATGFYYDNKSTFLEKENYIRFENPICVDNSFFVSYEITYDAVDSFAVYMVNNRDISLANTAYYKNGDTWKPFTEHPYRPISTSLWIEPVLRKDDGSYIYDPLADETSTVIYPNPCNDHVTVHNVDAKARTYKMYDLQGKLVLQTTGSSISVNINTNRLPIGIYFLRITSDNTHETHKIIKQ